ncbi:MAG TPA: hypothetical protein VHZ55_30325 [Bryobacteraceae bacterium]|nr:hypothetical protein [Bryobacteraceae bacterium]
MVNMRTFAVVARDDTLSTRVGNVQHATTSAATDQSCEKRLTASGSFGLHPGFHMCIGGNQSLIAFILLP